MEGLIDDFCKPIIEHGGDIEIILEDWLWLTFVINLLVRVKHVHIIDGTKIDKEWPVGQNLMRRINYEI
jgi:hypothetical protein